MLLSDQYFKGLTHNRYYNMTLSKICGITDEDNLEMVLSYEPNAVGFIVDVPVDTPRKISTGKAKELISRVPIFITSVLVIMPEGAEEAIRMVEGTNPGALQIHNDLPKEALKMIKDSVAIPIIKTIGVSGETEPEDVICKISELKGLIDAILLDTKTGGSIGGSGITHNWNLSKEIVRSASVPVILAGGLNPDNVSSAVSIVNPFAVDTGSGVESSPGKKDPFMVQKFIENSRA